MTSDSICRYQSEVGNIPILRVVITKENNYDHKMTNELGECRIQLQKWPYDKKVPIITLTLKSFDELITGYYNVKQSALRATQFANSIAKVTQPPQLKNRFSGS